MSQNEKGQQMNKRLTASLIIFICLTLFFISCSSEVQFDHSQLSASYSNTQVLRIKTTGYCKCQKCCAWQINAKGEAVFSYGKLKGKKKIVGQTASGHIAKKGTLAADTRYFPFKTKITIPGYGEGIVQDRGSAIKGYHLDLYFDTHQEAREWGVRYVDVIVQK